MIPQKTYRVGLYGRLSKDDERAGESLSIENQKLLLTKYIAEQPTWTLHDTYLDDGWSGTNFDRPAFQRMLSDAKEGIINLIIVKDLSRFGRNFVEIGQYTDYIFPAIGCRFVALNDNVDTIRNDNDFMPFKNLFNEFHSRDTSKKVRTVRKANAERGKFMGACAPYGYKKADDNKHKLIVNEQTAPVVRKIFTMRSKGMGFYAIASALNDERIPAPRETYYSSIGQESPASGAGLWSNAVVRRLMLNEVYLGHLVQGKSGTISFKNRKVVQKPAEEWIKVEHTHEPIIEQSLWDQVHELNAKKHRPKKTQSGESNMFTGLLRCADCGYPLRFQLHKDTHKDGSVRAVGKFLCGNYARSGKSACTAHVIKEETLTEVVLADIQRITGLVSLDERAVVDEVLKLKNTERVSQTSFYKRELKNLTNRIAELERFIQNLYEDRVRGTVPETVFVSLMTKYESEREAKSRDADILRQRVSDNERNWNNAAMWAELLKKYIGIQTLDAVALIDLIDRIEVGNAEIVDGKRMREIQIYYRLMEDVNLAGLMTEVSREYAV